MAAGYRIWVGAMSNTVARDDLMAAFIRFGDLSEGIHVRYNLLHPLGAEAVIT